MKNLKKVRGASRVLVIGGTLVSSLPVFAASQPADTAGVAALEEVIVTGSRTMVSGNDAPTPVTVVTTEQLTKTIPTTIPEALAQLPAFLGSGGNQSRGNAGSNPNAAALNLRGLGAGRTLILMDGRRVPAAAANGNVDANTLPQMLMQRVDVVTGGASAVYGSDAVSGVVNFILDHDFNGVKVVGQVGKSDVGDADTWRAGFAAGRSFLDGRLHLEGSYEHYYSAGLPDSQQRPSGRAIPCLGGNGTTAPYYLFTKCRTNLLSFGGLILNGPLAGQNFTNNGALSPFVHGASVQSQTTIESGGDGAWYSHASILAAQQSDQGFGRADFELTDSTHAFVQANLVKSYNQSNIIDYPTNGLGLMGGSATVSANNAFLTAAQQAAASAGGATTFNLGKIMQDIGPIRADATTAALSITAGLEGELGVGNGYDWNVFYTYARNRLHAINKGNFNVQKFLASVDAVINPANNQVVCNVTLTNPGLYPGCIPTNLFGPTSQAAVGGGYYRENTNFDLENKMGNFGFSIVGDVTQGWAGPIRMALSGEYRKLTLDNVSSAFPSTRADCTGLRFNCRNATTGATIGLWGNNTTENISASMSVKEGALEATVPLLSDLGMVKSLELNAAARYASYSTGFSATTWKSGLVWSLNDQLRLRGVRSRDIRAPTIFELYQPITITASGTTDCCHIVGNNSQVSSVSINSLVQTGGNPNLVPEEADTTSFGFVFQPDFLPRFSISMDFYSIKMTNAISSVNGGNRQVQQLCEDSGGTSPLCQQIVRPLPFSNRTLANYPTLFINNNRNIGLVESKGIDVDAGYNFPLAQGNVDLRAIYSHQQALRGQLFPGGLVIDAAGAAAGGVGTSAGPKDRVTVMAGYSVGDWAFNTQTNWRSGLKQNADKALLYAADMDIPSYATTNLNISRSFTYGGGKGSVYLTVQNLFDREPSLFSPVGSGGLPGYFVYAFDSVMGRYFTVGARYEF